MNQSRCAKHCPFPQPRSPGRVLRVSFPCDRQSITNPLSAFAGRLLHTDNLFQPGRNGVSRSGAFAFDRAKDSGGAIPREATAYFDLYDFPTDWRLRPASAACLAASLDGLPPAPPPPARVNLHVLHGDRIRMPRTACAVRVPSDFAAGLVNAVELPPLPLRLRSDHANIATSSKTGQTHRRRPATSSIDHRRPDAIAQYAPCRPRFLGSRTTST